MSHKHLSSTHSAVETQSCSGVTQTNLTSRFLFFFFSSWYTLVSVLTSLWLPETTFYLRSHWMMLMTKPALVCFHTVKAFLHQGIWDRNLSWQGSLFSTDVMWPKKCFFWSFPLFSPVYFQREHSFKTQQALSFCLVCLCPVSPFRGCCAEQKK